MSIVNFSFGTVSKTLVATYDGKAVTDLNSVSLYSYGKNDDGEQTFSLTLSQRTYDKANKVGHESVTYASKQDFSTAVKQSEEFPDLFQTDAGVLDSIKFLSNKKS